MKKTVRGKFPDDERDRVLTKGRIVSMVPMFPPVTFWQWKLFDRNGMPSDNDPRKLAPACTSAFWNGPMYKHIVAWDEKHKNFAWKRREAKKNEERKRICLST